MKSIASIKPLPSFQKKSSYGHKAVRKHEFLQTESQEKDFLNVAKDYSRVQSRTWEDRKGKKKVLVIWKDDPKVPPLFRKSP